MPNGANKSQASLKYESESNRNKVERSNIENNIIIKAGIVLPSIKSPKNKERIDRLKLKNLDDGKMDEINDMMSKIMDEL